ncbi:MAG: TIGR02266 family protein [Pseudomonadota bacterium]
MVELKGSERRQHPRIMVRVLVDFESSDAYFYDYSNNLSEGGIFIATDRILPMDTPVTLRFTLPNIDRVFQANGKVAWVFEPSAGDEGPPTDVLGKGMGVQFHDMDEKDRKLVRDYIQSVVGSR